MVLDQLQVLAGHTEGEVAAPTQRLSSRDEGGPSSPAAGPQLGGDTFCRWLVLRPAQKRRLGWALRSH